MKRINVGLIMPLQQLELDINIRNARSIIRPTYWRDLGYKVRLHVRRNWDAIVINSVSLPGSPLDIYFPTQKSFHDVLIRTYWRISTNHIFIHAEYRKQKIDPTGTVVHKPKREYMIEIWRPW